MKNLYGIIGKSLGHSFSPNYFAEKFRREGIVDSSYKAYPLASIEEFPALIEDDRFRGFNITIPYKELIIPYLDGLSPEAEEIGAVNCVRIDKDGAIGFNADAHGFEKPLLEMLNSYRPKNTLVLGSGGAAKAVCYILRKNNLDYQIVSRSKGEGKITYGELSDAMIADSHLIVDTTPLGTTPDVDTLPDINYDAITPEHFLYDLVYNPELTAFLNEGKKRGATTINGYPMLVEQAELSWKIWNRLI